MTIPLNRINWCDDMSHCGLKYLKNQENKNNYVAQDRNTKQIFHETAGCGTSEAIQKWELMTGEQWSNESAQRIAIIPIN